MHKKIVGQETCWYCFQDGIMKSTFPGFPEATYEISIDVTYKLRNSFEIACLLALLMAVDRSGQSEIVCV